MSAVAQAGNANRSCHRPRLHRRLAIGVGVAGAQAVALNGRPGSDSHELTTSAIVGLVGIHPTHEAVTDMAIRRRHVPLLLVVCLGVFGGAVVAATAARADSPAGFWYGTDSSSIAIPGSVPYREPAIGGTYGGYIGMAGNWANWQKCSGDTVVWSATDSKDADANFATYARGIGVGVYWFMAGPGVDPHYNGTTTEATPGERRRPPRRSPTSPTWQQGHIPGGFHGRRVARQAPGYTPATDNGWNSSTPRPAAGRSRPATLPAAVDRADFNGYAAYLTSHSSYKAGVYSSPSVWKSIFGTGTSSALTNTYEWTYTADTSSLAHHPSGWCLSGTSTCAQFFGGKTSTSKYALMWQWSGGGGTHNGYGDFDQIDAARTPKAS